MPDQKNQEHGRPDGHVAKLAVIAVAVTMAATCLTVGWSQHLIGPLWSDLMDFLTGAGLSIRPRDTSIPEIVLNAVAAVIVTVPLAVAGALLVVATGARKKIVHVPKFLFHECAATPPAPKGALALFLAMNRIAGIVMLEEFYARWIFLGMLASLAIFSGPNGFYFLFLAGNTAWTLLHYFNYKKGARTVLVLFPVFLIGCMQAVMFLRYGLLGAFVSHLVWDYVLLTPSWIGQTIRKRPLTL